MKLTAPFPDITSHTAYSRIVNNNTKNITLRTVASFCVGMGVGVETGEKLFAAAGMSFHNSKERYVYKFLLTDMEGRSIDDCNMFLESMGFELLGGRSYHETSKIIKA